MINPQQVCSSCVHRAKLALLFATYPALSKKITVISPDIFKEYRELCGQFGWYGNNIDQIAKHLNGDGDQYTVIRWLENYQMDLEDLIIRFKMLMEKKIAA